MRSTISPRASAPRVSATAREARLISISLRTRATRTSPSIRRRASSARGACERATRSRARSPSRSRGAASRRRSRRARTTSSWTPSASRAGRACRCVPRTRSSRSRSSSSGSPIGASSPRAPIAASGCSFRAELRGDEVVRMVPTKDGGANSGHSCVKGRFAWGYTNHDDRVLTPLLRERTTDPWREVDVGGGHSPHRRAIPLDPGPIRRRRDRRHHLVAMHERRGVRGPEDGPNGLPRTTTSTPAHACATHRPASVSSRRSGHRPAPRTSGPSSMPT